MKEQLIEKIALILEVESVSMQAELNSFEEWDSLTALSIISLVDADYGKTLSNEQLKKFITVKDLVDYILK